MRDLEIQVRIKSGERSLALASAETMEISGQACRLSMSIDITEGKQVEEELRQSEERFRLLVEGVKDCAIILLSPSGHTVSWNTGAELLTGYLADEIIGQHFSCFYPGEEVEQGKPERALLLAAESGQFEEEGWRLRKDGSGFWASVAITALRDSDGNLRGFAKVTRDITERKQAQEALQQALQDLEIQVEERTSQLRRANKELLLEIAERQQAEAALAKSEARLRALIENSSDLIAILEADGTIRFQSPAIEPMLGYKPESRAGHNVVDIIHPEDAPAVRSFFMERLQQPGIKGVIEYRVRHANGSWVRIESVANNLLDEPSIKGIVVNSRDVTERRRSEEQVVFQAELLNQVRNAVIATDLQENITYWNQFAERLYQWSSEEVIGKNIVEVLSLPQNKELAREIFASLETAGCWEGEFTVRRKDGSTFTAHVVDTTIRDAQGNPKGFVGVSEDITERVRAQEASKQSEALLRNILDTLPLGVWIADRQGQIVKNNPASEQIWGGARYVGTDQYDEYKGWWADTGERIAAREWALARALTKGEIYLNEVINIEAFDGKRKTILNSGVPLRNDRQEIIGAIAVNQDITDYMRVESALRESEQRYRIMADNSTDLISRHTPNGVYLYASPACRRLLGYEPEELLGHSVEEFLHPADAAALKQTLRAVGNLPDTYTLSHRHLRKDGSYIWFETTYRQVRHPERQDKLEIIEVSRDITERKQAEAEICALNAELEERVILRTAELQRANLDLQREVTERRRAEEQIKFQVNVLSQVSDAVVAIDSHNRIIYWNAGAERLYNCQSAEVLGRPIQEAYEYRWLNPSDEQAAVEALATTGSWHGEVIHIKNSGEELYVDISTSVLKDESGSPVGFLAVSRDMTERKRAKEALERLSHQNELILNSAGEGICGLDRHGKITFANPAAAKMLGSQVEELIDQPLRASAHLWHADGTGPSQPESPVCGAEMFQGASESDVAEQVREDVFYRRDGTSFPVELVCTPIQEQGELVGAVVTFKDISERKAVERMKQEFVSTVSHELRTPLTSMRGALGLIASGLLVSQPEKAQRMLEIAVSNTDRLVRLINDILDLERIESGKIAMDKKRCNAADLMLQAAETMQPMAQKAGVTLSVVPVLGHPQGVPLLADPDRILQTLTNLLSNAIKFSRPGSTIWLTGEMRDEGEANTDCEAAHTDKNRLIHSCAGCPCVLIAVKDQGRGIPADKLESVFERFQQVDASDARDKGGTGLGLAICRTIVQQHGGRIWAESVLGEGSTFYLSLPVRE
ncbi:MAG: PAS domain S-box protein [Oscillatoria princeps RMCB-10]|nr:PAS domain S-box protein [Oscillatoria princeps RMCB-10]